MRLLKEILNFFLTYFLRPVVYRFFVIRWELFRKPPYYFNYYGYKVYYRQKNGFSHVKSYLAVVVQKMINSQKSGVIFSGIGRGLESRLFHF